MCLMLVLAATATIGTLLPSAAGVQCHGMSILSQVLHSLTVVIEGTVRMVVP